MLTKSEQQDLEDLAFIRTRLLQGIEHFSLVIPGDTSMDGWVITTIRRLLDKKYSNNNDRDV